MKRLMYAALAVLAFVYPASAQITFSKTDFSNFVNSSSRSETFYTQSENGIAELAAKSGPNQLFDFSQLQYIAEPQGEEVIEYVPGGQAHPFSNVPEFLQANLVTRVYVPTENLVTYNFFKLEDDGMHAIGTGEFDRFLGLVVDHQVFPESFLMEKLPQTYGTHWVARVPFEFEPEMESDLASLGAHANEDEIVMTIETVIDGWGTLKLPNGHSYAALRSTVVITTSFMGFEFETKSVIFKTKEGHSADIIFDDEGEPVEASYTIAQWETHTSDPGDRSDLPEGFDLAQNYPNPFNPSTTIGYSIPFAADVTLTVVDLTGRVVSSLEMPRQAAGTHQVQFDAAKLGSGVYLYRIDAGGYSASRKFTLIK